jgi:uncharacterized membrane protein
MQANTYSRNCPSTFTVEETNMRGTIPVIAALAAGGWLLSDRMNKTRNMDLELPRRGSRPMFSVEESVVVRMPMRTVVASIAALAAGALLVTSLAKRRGESTSSSSVEESIELNVPVSTAYNQWTQFEEFPRFMESVQEVKQLDDTHLHWRADVAGKTKEWDAEITEQIPDERIAWRSTGGVQNTGVVTFHKIGDNRTKVMLQMDYEPETAGEKIGDALGGVKRTAKGNLKRFKQLVERRGAETGGWRGTVTQH